MLRKSRPPRPERNKLPRSRRTLAVVVNALVGCPVEVELKDDTVVSGVLEEVGIGMNLVLANVEKRAHPFSSLAGSGRSRSPPLQLLDFLYVQGRMIRYVHLPPRLNVHTTLRQHEKRSEYFRSRYTRTKRSAPSAAQRQRAAEGHAPIRLDDAGR